MSSLYHYPKVHQLRDKYPPLRVWLWMGVAFILTATHLGTLPLGA